MVYWCKGVCRIIRQTFEEEGHISPYIRNKGMHHYHESLEEEWHTYYRYCKKCREYIPIDFLWDNRERCPCCGAWVRKSPKIKVGFARVFGFRKELPVVEIEDEEE